MAGGGYRRECVKCGITILQGSCDSDDAGTPTAGTQPAIWIQVALFLPRGCMEGFEAWQKNSVRHDTDTNPMM